MNSRIGRWAGVALGAVLVFTAAACGDDDDDAADEATAADTTEAPSAATTAAPAEGTGEAPAATGEGITLAVNPWTGSAVNANVAARKLR